WRRAITLGLLVGGAAAVKLTGLAIIFAILPWYVLRCRNFAASSMKTNVPGISKTTPTRQANSDSCLSVSIRRIMLPLFVAALFVAPFYLRAWLLAGDPFYPYFARWFSSDPARMEMSRFHHELGSKFGLHGVTAFFAAPFFLAFMDDLFDGSFGWQFL